MATERHREVEVSGSSPNLPCEDLEDLRKVVAVLGGVGDLARLTNSGGLMTFTFFGPYPSRERRKYFEHNTGMAVPGCLSGDCR